jgi:hypothetical protein
MAGPMVQKALFSIAVPDVEGNRRGDDPGSLLPALTLARPNNGLPPFLPPYL